ATLARRELFNTVGLLNEKLWFADGMDWFLRARRHKVKVVMLNSVLVYHRIHLAGITRRRAEDSKKEFLAMTRKQLLLNRRAKNE
ncbi:MAG: GT2 family glycosyltransferase, partial [Parasphingorhabdus sp.]